MNSKINENLIFVFKRIIELIHDSDFLKQNAMNKIRCSKKKFNLEFKN